MDSPILDANGEPTGMYHAYNSLYCPEESKNTVAVLAYDRERVTDSVVANDDAFLLSTLQALPNGGICDVHTAETVKPPETNFDPLDPSTWPTDDPNFNPLDPSTWPNAGTQEPTDPDVTPSPGTSESPSVTETPEVTTPSPDPSGSDTEEPSSTQTPPEDSFVPAGNQR